MDPARWSDVREIFGAALELSGDERTRLLDERCGSDPALRLQVESLLARYVGIGGFLERPALGRLPLESALDALPSHGEPTSLLRPGDRLGPFEILSFLARGGTGEVYRALQARLGGRLVALKVLGTASLSHRHRARFFAEAQAASRIHHPHLVTVFDSGEDRGLVFYAMRLVEGKTLAELLDSLAAQSPPDAATRRALVHRFHEVALALAALHAQGLVHRDVKPQNIILEGGKGERPWDSPAVLVDFGLLRPADQNATHSVRWATPSYASPEHLLGERVDARADVFSLGLTMYDLLGGCLPDQRARGTDGRLISLRQRVPDLDPDLDAIVRLATDEKREWRYPTASALAGDLEAWLRGDPVSARRLRGIEGVRRWIERHPGRVLGWLVRSAAAALVGTLTIVGLLRVSQVLAAAGEVRRDWQSGHLASLAPNLQKVPRFLDGFLLPVQLAQLGLPLRQLEGEEPVVEVMRVLEDGGPGAALLHAARFLERDGVHAHPDLARYLLDSLQAAPVERDEVDGLRLVARLFFERPDAGVEDAADSEAFRSLMIDRLERGDRVRDRLYATTALSGCGTDASLPRMLAAFSRRAAAGEEGALEETRLTIRALEAIVRRGRACGFLERLDDADLHRLVATASEAAEQIERRVPLDSTGVVEGMVDLIRAVVFARQASGRPREGFRLPPRFAGEAEVRAAYGDPELERLLATDPARVVNFAHHLDYQFLQQYGFLAGSYGDEPLERRLEALVDGLLPDRTLDPAKKRESYRRGVKIARDEQRGVRESFRPDPRTHLGFPLASQPESAPIPVARGDDAIEPGLACTPGRVVLHGRVTKLETQACSFEADEDGQSRMLLLAVPDRSEIRFTFLIPPAVEKQCTVLWLTVSAQKGMRPLLPDRGEAWLDLFFDGDSLMRSVPVTDAASNAIIHAINRPSELAPREHTITIKLRPSSNTTVRIYDLGVKFRPDEPALGSEKVPSGR